MSVLGLQHFDMLNLRGRREIERERAEVQKPESDVEHNTVEKSRGQMQGCRGSNQKNKLESRATKQRGSRVENGKIGGRANLKMTTKTVGMMCARKYMYKDLSIYIQQTTRMNM